MAAGILVSVAGLFLYDDAKPSSLDVRTIHGDVTIPVADIRSVEPYANRGTILHTARPGEPEEVWLSPEPYEKVRRRWKGK